MSLLTFSKKMEMALEFWSLPFLFLMNASANLLVFVADSHGASLGPPGRQMRDTGAHLGGRLAAPGRLQGGGWVDTRPRGRQKVLILFMRIASHLSLNFSLILVI